MRQPLKLKCNAKSIDVPTGQTLAEFKQAHYPECDVVILNTVVNPAMGVKLAEYDELTFIRKGSIPPEDELEAMSLARQPADISNKLKDACVGIAGLGGLGSIVAENLVRAGVGSIVLVDDDVVEPSNLNRQRYFIHQIGEYKVDAMKASLKAINPNINIQGYIERCTPETIPPLLQSCGIVAECFDGAEDKAMLVRTIREQMPDTIIVAVSGVAGISVSKSIQVRCINKKLYMVGDLNSEVRDGLGLFATRVGVAASMQSHAILRLCLGKEP
jgi:sulfur carrier protein ThiS adenylyltransferase